MQNKYVVPVVVLAAGVATAHFNPSTTRPVIASATAPSSALPTTRRVLARLDLDVWKQRQLDHFRKTSARWSAATQPADEGEQRSLPTLFMFTMVGDVALLDDDAASAALASIVDEALKDRRPDAAPKYETHVRAEIERARDFYRLSKRDRWIKATIGKSQDDDDDNGKRAATQPVGYAGGPNNFVSNLSRIPDRYYEEYALPLIEEMDRIERAKGDFAGLALAYCRLAHDELRRERRDMANRHIDRMLAILAEHPDFQDPRRGNTDGVMPANVAHLLTRAGRGDEAAQWADRVKLNADAAADLAAGRVSEAAKSGDAAAVRGAIETQVRAIGPKYADLLIAVLDDRPLPTAATTTTAPATMTAADGRPRRRPPTRDESRWTGVAIEVAQSHADRGDVDLAVRQWLAVASRDGRKPSTWHGDTLPAHDWANLALRAARNGHTNAAARAFESAIASDRDEAERFSKSDADALWMRNHADRAAMIRAFVAIRDFEAARDLLNTSSQPGSGTRLRLTKAYFKAGCNDDALAMLKQTIEVAERGERGGGHAMFAAAVILHDLGDRAEAERVLVAAFSRIAGEDFGFGGAGAAVQSAREMDRLDLLDRLYELQDEGGQMLLAMTAARAAWYQDEPRRDDEESDQP